jgi:hypothetical protein
MKTTTLGSVLLGLLPVSAIVAVVLWAPIVAACTTFVLDGGGRKLLGENYDFYYAHGAVFVNPAGLQKQALADNEDLPLRWVARLGSVTFNQFGRELPVSGMNEHGLAIALMWNAEGGYPRVDSRKVAAINELQWIQYQLDNASSLNQVIASLATPPIRKIHADLHYALCDASGSCGIIEFLAGAARVYRDADYSPAALTNDSYATSLRFFEGYKGGPFGSIPDKRTSLHHFARTAWLVRASQVNSESDGQARAFEILSQVSSDYEFLDLFRSLVGRPPSVTAWSIVFDPVGRSITYRTRGNAKRRSLSVGAAVRRSEGNALALDIDQGTDDVTGALEPYLREHNARIVTASFKPIQKQFPPAVQQELIRYPESFVGVGTRGSAGRSAPPVVSGD